MAWRNYPRYQPATPARRGKRRLGKLPPAGLLGLAALAGIALGIVFIDPEGDVRFHSAAAGLAGQASVIDGDTLDLHGERIRLWGVDAPEGRQSCADAKGRSYRCGQRAAMALDSFIAGRPISCAKLDTDRYGRSVARCSAGGQDLGAWLVRNGYAIDYTRYSHGRYAMEQMRARQGRAGIWAGSFERPEDWRHRR